MDQTDGSLRKKALRSGAWLGVAGALIGVLNFIRSIVLARLLTPDIFGLMSIALMFSRSFDALTRPGVVPALIHRKGSFDQAKDTVFVILLARGFLLTVLLIFASPYIASFYEQPILEDMLWVMAIGFVLLGGKNINVVAKAKALDYKQLAILDQLLEIINTSVVIALAFWLDSVWALVIGYITSSGIITLLSYILIPGKPRFDFNIKIAKELLKYGKFITGTSIVLFIVSQLDNAVVGKILGVEQLGYYVLAFTTANFATTYVAKLAAKVLFPVFSHIQDDKKATRKAFLQVFELLSIVVIPAALGLLMLSSELVVLLYGEKWLPSAYVLNVLCVFGLARAFASMSGNILNGIGKPHIDFYLSILRVTLIVVSIYPLTISYGLVGTALSVTFSMVIHAIIVTIGMRWFIGLNLFKILKVMLGAILKSLFMVAIIILGKIYFDLSEALSIIGLVIFSASIYILLSRKRLIIIIRGNN